MQHHDALRHHADSPLPTPVHTMHSALHIGAIVMILHDISDPFMEFAKLCLYAKHEIVNANKPLSLALA